MNIGSSLNLEHFGSRMWQEWCQAVSKHHQYCSKCHTITAANLRILSTKLYSCGDIGRDDGLLFDDCHVPYVSCRNVLSATSFQYLTIYLCYQSENTSNFQKYPGSNDLDSHEASSVRNIKIIFTFVFFLILFVGEEKL